MWRCPVLCAANSILLLHSMALLVLHLLQRKESWLDSGFQFSALRWMTLSKQLNSRVSCLKLERTPTPEILKMAFTFVFSICVYTQGACARSGQRLTWGIFCSLPYCFTIINLFSDNFVHIYNAFWSYPLSPLLTPCYLHLLSSHQVSVSLSYLLATHWA